MFDVKKVREEAEKELREEAEEAAKKKLISKLKELDRARKVVRNLERELEEIELDIGE